MLLTLCAPHRDLMVERGRHEGKVDRADDAVLVFAAQFAGQPSFADAAIDEISSRELAQFDNGRCGVAKSREPSVCEANSECQSGQGSGVERTIDAPERGCVRVALADCLEARKRVGRHLVAWPLGAADGVVPHVPESAQGGADRGNRASEAVVRCSADAHWSGV